MVTCFDQGIAATAGFFKAAPLCAHVSWATIRGCQGKRTPWFLLGLPAAIQINALNIVVIGILIPSGDQTYPTRDQSFLMFIANLKA